MQDLKMIQGTLITTILFSVILKANSFCYKDAQKWGETNKVCKGKNQSPIVLKPPEKGYPKIKKDLVFTNFKKDPKSINITNTAHTVELRATWDENPPSITGGPLKKKYIFDKITFAWAEKAWTAGVGQIKDTGSKPPKLHMEMHMYFYREDLKSYGKGESQKDGLAAFQIFLREGKDNPSKYFDILEKNVNKVQARRKSEIIPPFRLGTILADAPPTFDFYEGSILEPPCTESVIWFVWGVPVTVKDKVIDEFRKVRLGNGDKANIRPPQQMNGRKIQSCDSCNGKDN